MQPRIVRRLSVALLALAASACSDTPFSPPDSIKTPTAIKLTLDSVTVAQANTGSDAQQLYVGSSLALRLNAEVKRSRYVVWTSSAPATVAVDAVGNATGIKVGQATVTATSLGGTQSFALTVLARTAKVNVSPASVSVAVGSSAQVTATLIDPSGAVITSRTPTYSSSNTGLFTVSTSGLVSGKAAGSATLTVKDGTVSTTVPVQVTSTSGTPAKVITSLRFAPRPIALLVDSYTQFSAIAGYSDGSSATVAATWTVSGGSMSGTAMYHASTTAGTYRIVATTAGTSLRDSLEFQVSLTGDPNTPPPSPTATVTSFAVSPKTGSTLAPGTTRQFSTTTVWSDGATRASTITYTVSGGSVSTTGLYTAGATAGTYPVIATCSCGPADTGSVSIAAVVPTPATLTNIVISPKTVSISTGAVQALTTALVWSAGVLPSPLPSLAYSTLDGGSVSASGSFTAPSSAGNYRVVVAQVGGVLRDTATVTVVQPIAPPPPSAGDPVPGANDRILLDTRAGGAQSWQGQGISTLQGALDRMKVNGSAVEYNWAGDGDVRSGWVPNFDGNGTSVFRSSMAGVNMTTYPDGLDGGGGKLQISMHNTAVPLQHMVFQFKVWMGRTALGGGLGQNGLFTLHNDLDAAHNAGRKLLLIMRDSPKDPGGGTGRIDVDWRGLNPVPMQTSIDIEGFYNQPTGTAAYGATLANFQPQGLINSWVTVTVELQNGTTETSPDGYMRVWYNGVLYQDIRNIPTANYPIAGIQLGVTFRSPKQDQTEYYKDILAWSHQ